MVDSEGKDLSENEGFKSDLESEKKLDSKDEANLSFYECPTAAASIQGFGEETRYNSNSLDSDQDYNFYDSLGKSDSLRLSNHSDSPSPPGVNLNGTDLGPVSTDGGSVSFSNFTRAEGGYFAGYQAVLYEGNPTLKEKPSAFLDENSLKLAESQGDFNHTQNHSFNSTQMVPEFNTTAGSTGFSGGFTLGAPVPTSAPNYTVSAPNPSNLTPFSGNMVNTTHHVPYVSTVENTIPFTVTSVRTENTSRNEFSTPGSALISVSQAGTGAAHGSLLSAISEGERSNTTLSVSGQTSNLSYVQEGFDTIAVPRYRPVEVVETTVEVPVVHHIDTFVPKKEIQEIENYVKKPYTKYVDKVVEVPQVHYTDKIVEVPEYHEITKTVPKVEVQEKTNYVPKVEVKVVPKYVEVPVVKIVDKYEEYEQVEEVVKHVEKVEVVEVPREVVKTVVKPVRKIVEKEKIVPVYEHRDVPVEKIKYVPKVETVEHVREVPKVVDVPVPYNVPKHQFVDQPYIVPKYRDVPVAVPVAKTVKPVYEDKGPTNYIDVPVHKPYFVIHDHLNFKPVNTFNNPGGNNPNSFVNVNMDAFSAMNTGVGTNTVNPGGAPSPGNPHGSNFTFNNFGPNPNPNFNPGSQFKDFQHVSYKVVGMNRVDLEKMAPEEKKLAQEKLNEALENPNFQVYKQSMGEAAGTGNFDKFEGGVTWGNGPNGTNFVGGNNATHAGGFNTWGPNTFNGFNPDVKGSDFKKDGLKPDFPGNKAKFNPSVKPWNNNAETNEGVNGGNSGWNAWQAGFGNPNAATNWNRWNSATFNNSQPAMNPNTNPNFQPGFNNLNNKYKYDSNYSTSLFNWTDKLFKFFTGSKAPGEAPNPGTFNNNTPFNPNRPMGANMNKFKGPANTNPNFTEKNPFSGFGNAGAKSNFWDRNNYNLVQESFRNWKVPNMHLDLEKNTPTNKMLFQEKTGWGSTGGFFNNNQYHMSSGSGSVGHRAGFNKDNVYPTSDTATPKVH